VGRLAGRDEQHPVEPEGKRRLLRQDQVTEVGRIERTPEDAQRTDALPPHLAVAVDDVLGRGQLA
jgi:hypothetical protein